MITPEIIIYIIISLVTVIGFILSTKLEMSFGRLKMNFSKNNRNRKKQIESLIAESADLARRNCQTIYEYKSSILKNEMIFVRGKLSLISTRLAETASRCECLITNELAYNFLKKTLVENGFASLSQHDLEEYINFKVNDLRTIYKNNVTRDATRTFIDGTEFKVLIEDIYRHSVECCLHWTEKIKQAELEYIRAYNELLKDI